MDLSLHTCSATWEHPEDTAPTVTVRNESARGSSSLLRSALESTVGTAAAKWGKLNVQGYWILLGARVMCRPLITEGQVGTVTIMDSRIKATSRTG